MALFAVFEAQVAAEGSPAVVAGQTRRTARVDEMLGCGGRAHLARLWRSGGETVTVRACESLTRAVICVAECVTIRARVCGRGPVSLLFVANSARGDLASCVRFTRRRVTRVAVVVCCEVGGNRQACAAVRGRTMATRATTLRARGAGVVLRVIEFHVELFVEACREIFQRRIVAADVGVADRTHRDSGRSELTAMTVSAGFVTGETWSCGVVGSFMARIAGEGTVALRVVKESRVIDLSAVCYHGKAEYTDDADFKPRIDHLMSFRLSGTRSAIR